MTVTEEAVDAAAEAIYMRHHGICWKNESDQIRGLFLRDARAAMDAAAPLLASTPQAARQ